MTYEKQEKYWSRFVDTFNEDQRYIVGEEVQRELIDRLSQERDLGEIVELGCGAGFYTRVLAENANRVIATDLSDEMLETARTMLKDLQNVAIEKADCEKTSFPDDRFDSVFMANLVHIIENPLITIKESHRVLKDGGLIIIISYTSYGMNLFQKLGLIFRFLKAWGKPPKGFRSFSPDGLRSLVESAGFKVEQVQLIGNKSKGLYLIARK
jgi:ubiquinone/menaquinone biosynthesis C-methylase UbiE